MIDWKKIAIIAGFITLVIILGWLIYFTFFRPAFVPTPTDNVNDNVNVNAGLPGAGPGGRPSVDINAPGALPGAVNGNVNVNVAPLGPGTPQTLPSPIASGGLTKTETLSDTATYGVALSSDGNKLVYYDRNDGKFYKLNSKGEKEVLSDKVFHQVQNVTWSENKNKAILEYPDGANILYNFETEKQTTLPRHWQEFDFSPDNKQITAKSLGVNPENRFLIVANPDGSSARSIAALGENADIVYPDWSPNNQVVAMYVKGKDYDRQELFFLGLRDENFKSIIIAGRGFQGQWSPKGDKILYSVHNSANQHKPILYIVDAQGERIGLNLKNLKTFTWANKCTFADNDTIYCAVPTQLDEGAGFSQDLGDKYPDIIYKINLITGYRSVLAIPETNHTISKIMVTDNGRYLYFQDKFTRQIYKIALK